MLNHESTVSRLQELAENALGKVVFEHTLHLESLQAIMILAIWTPVGGKHHVARDGRLLIIAAISAAVNLRIDEAAAYVSRAESAALNGGVPADIVGARNKARLVRRMRRS